MQTAGAWSQWKQCAINSAKIKQTFVKEMAKCFIEITLTNVCKTVLTSSTAVFVVWDQHNETTLHYVDPI